MIIKKGEIWLANLNPSIAEKNKHQRPVGLEVGKSSRPVLIYQSDLLNEHNGSLSIVLPISSKKLEKTILRHEIHSQGLKIKPSYVLVDQIRSIDKNQRLIKKIGEITHQEMIKIDWAVIQILDLSAYVS